MGGSVGGGRERRRAGDLLGGGGRRRIRREREIRRGKEEPPEDERRREGEILRGCCYDVESEKETGEGEDGQTNRQQAQILAHKEMINVYIKKLVY